MTVPRRDLLMTDTENTMRHDCPRTLLRAAGLIGGLWMAAMAAAQAVPTTWKFDFGPGKAASNHVRVAPGIAYEAGRGYGFEPGGDGVIALPQGGVTSHTPFLFSVALPEGNYNVTVTLGDRQGESDNTVKAELRRLMLEKVETTRGQIVTRTFTVNVRTPPIASGGEVHLKARERSGEMRNWDDRLTLEFNGAHPCLQALEIAPAPNALTVYVMGDSTVTDQPDEPWAAWGQMLPRFFGPGVAVANYAESGESLRSSLGARRLDKVLSVIKPGDYVFLQFGHNDQKERGESVGAFTTYTADLEHYVAEARQRGALPVLVTSMNRRRFDAQGKLVPTLGDYPEAVRRVAHVQNVPLIDLNAMSKTLFETLGPEGTLKAFVHYPANSFPGQTAALKDDTHFNAYGAYELARCVVEGIRANVPALAKHLANDIPRFDPARPDPVTQWSLPASPASTAVKPEGS